MSSVKLVFNCETVSVWCVGLAGINRPGLGNPGSAGEDVQRTVEGMHNNKWLFQSSPVRPSLQVCFSVSVFSSMTVSLKSAHKHTEYPNVLYMYGMLTQNLT